MIVIYGFPIVAYVFDKFHHIRGKHNVANDAVTGDAELVAIEIKEI